MVDGAVRVTQRVEIAIFTPAITDDRRASFDPFTYNRRQRVGGSVQDGSKKCSAEPSFDTATPTDPERGALYCTFADRSCSCQFRPPIFSELPSKNSSMVSPQNMPQSAIAWSLRPSSFSIWWAWSRRRMSCVIRILSMRLRLLSWNLDPCLVDAVPRHLTPATLFRHRHLNPSARWGFADHVISRSQMLHGNLYRISPLP